MNCKGLSIGRIDKIKRKNRKSILKKLPKKLIRSSTQKKKSIYLMLISRLKKKMEKRKIRKN
jgi:hypothetical protein